MKANHIASYTFIKYGISLPGLVCSVLLPVYQKRKYRHNSWKGDIHEFEHFISRNNNFERLFKFRKPWRTEISEQGNI